MLNVQESIARLKAAWSEVARSNPESVNIGQFIVSIAHLTMTVKIKIGIRKTPLVTSFESQYISEASDPTTPIL
jgi:hypothetical protein